MTKAGKGRKAGIVLGVIFALLIFYLVYGFWVSKNDVVVHKEEFSSDKVESPWRILFISDLHDDHSSRFREVLKTEAEQLQPDLIAMGGDMVNSDTADFSDLLELIGELPKGIPVIYVPGNEELDNPDLKELTAQLEKKNVHYLDQDYLDLTIKDQNIRIGGLYDYSFALDGEATPNPEKTNPKTAEYLSDFQNTESQKIMVHHRPDSFIFSSEPDYWNIDFSITGHAHGGQIVLPLLGGLWAPDQGWYPEYVHGKYQLGQLTMFITSGISTGKQVLPRFNNPMEIMIIDVNSKNSA